MTGANRTQKLDQIVLVRITKELGRRLDVICAARSEMSGMSVGRSDVMRDLISEAFIDLEWP
jgi:hypothetical protein